MRNLIIFAVAFALLALCAIIGYGSRRIRGELLDVGIITRMTSPVVLYKNGWEPSLNERRAVTIDDHSNYNIAASRCSKNVLDYCEVWKDASGELYLK